MCQRYHITYSCYPQCKTGKKDPLQLVRCELFRDTKNLPWDNDRCSDENGGNGRRISLQRLRLRHRCSSCVTKAVAARVMERNEREERERNAERRGERGDVLRQLRLEEDEEEEVTPKVSQYQFASANFPVCGHDPGGKVNFDVEADLTAKMEDELKAGASSEYIAHRPASAPATPPLSLMPMLLSDTLKMEEGPPEFLADSDGDFGLGIYF
ncbi:6a769432-1a59-48c0-a3df-dc3c1bc14fce-CDS [Sclerotinia trifoliorum]|uniref:6a769432-1a59-48c0-a3df-dc3c1bc14fce-CDS n=1 Tax=Sclerotinia trifoliorum TaxID=28548 RepID=A0A8H2ZP12_9HELO|nr:6a769432-1a59-48c0-a3df-dc3c1bc14fce-CDS [Sclerotinia trifoliorum]